MADIDHILDTLDPKSGQARAAIPFKDSPLLLVIVLLVLISAAGAAVAVNVASSSSAPPEAQDAASAGVANLWAALLHEAPACILYDGQRALKSVDGRSLALFAAARYDCPELAREVLSSGSVDLEERRFVNGEVLTIEDYAAQFGAMEVIKVVLEEKKRIERENQEQLAAKQNRKNEAALHAAQRDQELQMLLIEDAELRKSIFYGRARLECEVLKEKLGFSAPHFRMNECVRGEIERRRLAREELGHNVPG